MSFFEFLPLIIILLLQFLYQFQKVARKKINRNKLNASKNELAEEKKNDDPSFPFKDARNRINVIDEGTEEKEAETPIHRDFFQDNFSFSSPAYSEPEETVDDQDKPNLGEENASVEVEIFNNSSNESQDKGVRDQIKKQTVYTSKKVKKMIINFLKKKPKEAIILSEILGKPKF